MSVLCAGARASFDVVARGLSLVLLLGVKVHSAVRPFSWPLSIHFRREFRRERERKEGDVHTEKAPRDQR